MKEKSRLDFLGKKKKIRKRKNKEGRKSSKTSIIVLVQTGKCGS